MRCGSTAESRGDRCGRRLAPAVWIGCARCARACVAQRLLRGPSAAKQAEEEHGTCDESREQQYAQHCAGEAIIEEQRCQSSSEREACKRTQPAAHAGWLRCSWRCWRGLL